MFNSIFGDTFDFNRDGELDYLERNAEFITYLEMIREAEAIEKPLEDMTDEEIWKLATLSGAEFDNSNF